MKGRPAWNSPPYHAEVVRRSAFDEDGVGFVRSRAGRKGASIDHVGNQDLDTDRPHRAAEPFNLLGEPRIQSLAVGLRFRWRLVRVATQVIRENVVGTQFPEQQRDAVADVGEN